MEPVASPWTDTDAAPARGAQPRAPPTAPTAAPMPAPLKPRSPVLLPQAASASIPIAIARLIPTRFMMGLRLQGMCVRRVSRIDVRALITSRLAKLIPGHSIYEPPDPTPAWIIIGEPSVQHVVDERSRRLPVLDDLGQ